MKTLVDQLPFPNDYEWINIQFCFRRDSSPVFYISNCYIHKGYWSPSHLTLFHLHIYSPSLQISFSYSCLLALFFDDQLSLTSAVCVVISSEISFGAFWAQQLLHDWQQWFPISKILSIINSPGVRGKVP